MVMQIKLIVAVVVVEFECDGGGVGWPVALIPINTVFNFFFHK